MSFPNVFVGNPGSVAWTADTDIFVLLKSSASRWSTWLANKLVTRIVLSNEEDSDFYTQNEHIGISLLKFERKNYMRIFSMRTAFLLIVAIVLPLLKKLSDCTSNMIVIYSMWTLVSIAGVICFGFVIRKMMEDKSNKIDNVLENIFYIILPIIVMSELYWISMPMLEHMPYYLLPNNKHPITNSFFLMRHLGGRLAIYLFFFPIVFFVFCWVNFDVLKNNKKTEYPGQ